jgi:signal transduction histidine kinase
LLNVLEGMELVIAVNQNISEMRKSIEKHTKPKENADAAKSEAVDHLAWIGHEIRTPLNSIIEYT